MHMENGQHIAILPFSKHFNDGHCAEILQRCMQDLVLDKMVILFTAK